MYPLCVLKSYAGKLSCRRDHHPVPGHLGQHRRGRDAGGDPVALPHRQAGRGEPGHGEAVGQDVGRYGPQPGERPAHAADVRLRAARPGRPPAAGSRRRGGPAPGRAPRRTPAPARRRQQLGVGKAGDLPAPALGEHHRGDHQRPGAGAATGLVGAGHRAQAMPRQRALETPEPGVAAHRQPSRERTHRRHRGRRAGRVSRQLMVCSGYVVAGAARLPASPVGRRMGSTAMATTGTPAKAAGVPRVRRCEVGQMTTTALPSTSRGQHRSPAGARQMSAGVLGDRAMVTQHPEHRRPSRGSARSSAVDRPLSGCGHDPAQ